MIREIIFFTWSIINITVFTLILYGLLSFIPKIKPKTRMILTVVGSLFYVGFFGVSFGEMKGIYKNAPSYPYKTKSEIINLANFGSFKISSFVEYETPKMDTLLKPRIRKANCFIKGFTLGYHWDMPEAKGSFHKKKGKDVLIIETHGKLEWRLLGIKVRSSTYSLSEDIPIEK
jgi:hypothetical protein